MAFKNGKCPFSSFEKPTPKWVPRKTQTREVSQNRNRDIPENGLDIPTERGRTSLHLRNHLQEIVQDKWLWVKTNGIPFWGR